MRLVLALIAAGIFATLGLSAGFYLLVRTPSPSTSRTESSAAEPTIRSDFFEEFNLVPKPEVMSPVTTEPAPLAAAAPTVDHFEKTIKPFLNQYCNSCHNSDKNAAGVALDAYLSEAHARKDRKVWEMVEQVVSLKEMPPKKKPQPKDDERKAFLAAIESLTKIDCTAPKDPGRVTVRRLNRAEYNNTIRDLCGVDIKPAEDFPSDDVGYGFDNIGDVLSLQPILIEKYLAAADKILDTAIVPLNPVASSKQTFRPQQIQVIPRDSKTREANNQRKIRITAEGLAFLDKFHFPAAGRYTIRIRAWGSSPDDIKPKASLRLNAEEIFSTEVLTPEDKPINFEKSITLEPGERRVAVAFTNPSNPKQLKPGQTPRTLGIEVIEIEGPIGGGTPTLPASTQKILTALPGKGLSARAAAEKTISDFARRAYRRPVRFDEVERLLTMFDFATSKKEPFEQAIKLPLKAILVSPNFLFRVEADPTEPDGVRTISEFELATRLSYFLWSTMPDEELYRLAEKGELRNPGVLEAQVRRMLKDPRASSLTQNFAGQWLMLRSIPGLTPDTKQFPNWDESLRSAMIKETELFFEHIVKNDRKITELLDADYTFVNERLARHYGLKDVRGPEFRQVKLPDNRRGGIVTQASVLTVTSNPTRTSPVKRGKWILENLLGVQPPPPAPDVPELPPVGEIKGSLRQQMEQHRANPACATCHEKLDPLGFGLENFDAVGAWRDQDNKQKIDASGVLPDGSQFDGPAELRKVLLKKSAEFRKCFAEKLLTYALGRGLEFYDKCVLTELSQKLQAGDDTFSSLVIAIVNSDPFQKRKGKRSE